MSNIDELYEKVTEGKADPSFLVKQELTSLLKLASRFRKKRKEKDKETGGLRIAVLGSYSIQHFVMMLEVFLAGLGIEATIYEGEYDGIRMDVLNSGSSFYDFDPEMVLLLMDHRDIRSYPVCMESEDSVEELANSTMKQFAELWDRIHESLPGCQIFQTNIVIPVERPLGNLEGSVSYSHAGFLRRIDQLLAIGHPEGLTVVDMEYIASYVGKSLWFDQASYFLSKTGFSADALPVVCASFARLIAAASGRVFKCLVLDLDNTLWDGVVGDDGYDGINLDPHDPVGEAYRYFQNYVLELKKRGVILAVCSKNDEPNAKEPFEKNPDMILKLSDISCFVANWDDKVSNIKRIASTLNIGTDALVFVDDNPAERDIVRSYLPEVLVVDLPEDPSYYARALEESNAFSWIEITREDLNRTGTYAANARREELLETFADYDEYLRALEMEAETGDPQGSRMKRFAQLINKSNQFNLRTQRYSEEELSSMRQDPDTRLIYISLKDRFSEYGIISCIILKRTGEECFIDTWLMSCRVLKRGVELLAYDAVYEAAKEWGCSVITGEYLPTKKNGMVKSLYPDLGFTGNGEGLYRMELKDYKKGVFYITRKDQ
ncbi:MAG: HAD-IIIC family phosphatase [Lachnospiraceae bacterium]|nr:HAD-IIIC family phosphatase [Lachnospiraceae bacterium]